MFDHLTHIHIRKPWHFAFPMMGRRNVDTYRYLDAGVPFLVPFFLSSRHMIGLLPVCLLFWEGSGEVQKSSCHMSIRLMRIGRCHLLWYLPTYLPFVGFLLSVSLCFVLFEFDLASAVVKSFLSVLFCFLGVLRVTWGICSVSLVVRRVTTRTRVFSLGLSEKVFFSV